jgi:two-component system response regulator YesN
MKLSFNSVLYKLIIFGLGLGAIPIICIGSFSYYISTNSAQAKVIDSNRNTFMQTQSRVEQLFEIVDTMSIQLINSSFINSALNYPYPINDVNLIYQIDRGLKQIQLYQLEIEDVTFYNLEHRWFVNNRGFSETDSEEQRELLQSVVLDTRTSYWQQDATLSPSNGEDMLLIKKIPVNSIDPEGVLVVRISANKINSIIASSSIAVLDEQMKPMYTNTEVAIQPDVLQHIDLENNQGQFEQDGYLWMYNKAAYNKWMYVSVIALDSLTQESKRIGWVTVGLCLIIFLLSILFSIFGSFNIYSPIRRVTSLLKTPEGEGKNINEMEIIVSGIHSLYNSQSELKTKLYQQTKQFNEQLVELFVRRLFNGGLKPKEIDELLVQYDQRISWTGWSVMLLQIDNFEQTHYSLQDFDLFMFAVNNIVSEIIPAEHQLMPIIIDRSLVTLVGNRYESKDEHKNEMYRFAEEIQSTVMKYLRLKVSIGISYRHVQLTEVPVAHNEAMEALKYRIRVGAQAILFIEDVQPAPSFNSVFPVRQVNDLVEAVKESDSDKSRQLLEGIIQEIFGVSRPQSEYQIMLTRLLIELIKVIENTGTPLNEVLNKEEHLFDILLKELKSPEEIKLWFAQAVIDPIASFLNERSKRHARQIADQILEVIHQRYESDLTLEECAKQLNYSVSYIKKIIRNELGNSFTEYLYQHRLEVAKHWLVDTDMKIAEIAERLKYNNATNFIRYFKKQEGTTPGKFREQASASAHSGQKDTD